MPKSISPKDRILSYAFTATTEQLEEAVSIFSAALKAKRGVSAPRTRKPQPRPVVAPKTQSGQPEG
jgi:hypothetical protein